MKRQRGTMEMDLFHKIIDEAVSIPIVEQVTLTGLGEPFLDKNLVERVKYIRKKMPGIEITVFSNGSYLTEEKSRELRDAGLSILYVSLNAVNKKARQEIMKLDDYETVTEQLHKAMEIGGDKMKVIVKAIVSKDLMQVGESDKFSDNWGGPYNEGGSAFLHLEGNWAGDMWPMRVKPTAPCSRALKQIMVLWDGRVSLCCFDGEGKEILGDLKTQTIREVFNGEKATGIRLAHVQGRRGELPLCETCTSI
jgi:hypothetical protein